jgi:hypothetical protein
MPVRIARESGALLDQALAALLPAEPYLAYANFPAVARREGAVFALHRRRWQTAGDGLGVLVARDERDVPLAAISLGPRDFESEHFGVRMAKVDPPLAVADEPRRLPALAMLYDAACARLREQGYQHLSGVASTRDRVTCWALQARGAFQVGTKISWMQSLTGVRHEPELTLPLRIECYDRSSIGSIDRAAWRRLYEWSGGAFERGPYVFDLSVPHERAMAVYQVWTAKAMTGEWADTLLVVRDGDEIVAFHSMLRLDDLSEAAGVGIVGRGIGGTLPGYRGLFTALQKECAAARPLGAAFLENETQAATAQTINVFGKLGHHCLGSTASFHMRLEEPGAWQRSGAG